MDHLIINCETGEASEHTAAQDSSTAVTAMMETLQAADAAKKAQHEADLTAIRAKAAEDSSFAALARAMGVDLTPHPTQPA